LAFLAPLNHGITKDWGEHSLTDTTFDDAKYKPNFPADFKKILANFALHRHNFASVPA
jgi:hypothetical protein